MASVVGPAPRRARRARGGAVACVAAGLFLAVGAVGAFVPDARALAHLAVVAAALALALWAGRVVAVGAAVLAELALVAAVVVSGAPVPLPWLVGEAALTLAVAVAGGVVLTETRRRTEAVLDRLHAVDQAVVAFAATSATAATADAVRAGLRVVLPSSALVRLELGPTAAPATDLAGMVLATTASSGERAVLPDGFTSATESVLVGFPVRHGIVDAGGLVVRVPSATPDADLELVDALLRRIAPTLAAQAAATTWAAADPTPDRDAALARAAHDLRVPLTSLTGAVETLVQYGEVMQGDQRAELYAVLTRSTRRVSRWVSALLEDSLSSTATRAQPRVVPLRRLLEGAAEAATAATTGMEVELADTELHVEADPGLVIRVLTNLLANAGHHASSGGSIEVTAQERGDHVEVRVVDHGPGIAPDAVEAVTRQDGRGRWLGGGDGAGLGLGLASARTLVAAWGGQFGIGTTPGGGATIWFTLPLADAPDAPSTDDVPDAVEEPDASPEPSGAQAPVADATDPAADPPPGTDPPGAIAEAATDPQEGDAAPHATLAEESDEPSSTARHGESVRWTVVGPDPSSLPDFLRRR